MTNANEEGQSQVYYLHWGFRWNADHAPAFRDRQAGSYNNRSRPVDEHKEAQRRGVRARDDRGARVRNDRHSRSGHTYVSFLLPMRAAAC